MILDWRYDLKRRSPREALLVNLMAGVAKRKIHTCFCEQALTSAAPGDLAFSWLLFGLQCFFVQF